MVKERAAWHASFQGVTESDMTEWLNHNNNRKAEPLVLWYCLGKCLFTNTQNSYQTVKPTTHRLEWLKSKAFSASNAANIWSNNNHQLLLVWIQCDAATLEDSLAVSFKVKYMLLICPAILSSAITQWSWKYILQGILSIDVSRSFIDKCQNMGKTKTSFNR